jgi:hypothetical protein
MFHCAVNSIEMPHGRAWVEHAGAQRFLVRWQQEIVAVASPGIR